MGASAARSQRAAKSPPFADTREPPLRARGLAQVKGCGTPPARTKLPSWAALPARATQEKDAFFLEPDGVSARWSQWVIHGVQEKYLRSCISWAMEGGLACGHGRPARWECPVPGPGWPLPNGPAHLSKKRGLRAPLPRGPYAPAHSSSSQGTQRRCVVFLRSAVFLLSPFVTSHPGPEPGGEGEELATQGVDFLYSLPPRHAGAGGPWTLFLQSTSSPLSASLPLPAPRKYCKEAHAAALAVGKPIPPGLCRSVPGQRPGSAGRRRRHTELTRAGLAGRQPAERRCSPPSLFGKHVAVASFGGDAVRCSAYPQREVCVL